MSLLGPLMKSPESSEKTITEHFPEWRVLKPEMIEAMQRLLDYWKPRLADAPTLELPTDRPRPAIQSFRGETQQFSLSPELTEALKALSRRESVTLFMTLLASFQALLHRYSGQDDIVIGTPAAGRSRLELEGLIGFFVNTLVLRTDLSNNPSFRALLAQVREVTLDAYAHQDMPFEKLVEVLNPQRDHSRNPLFQVMFVLQNVPDDKLQLNEITAEFFQVNTGTTKFDLTFELSETPHGLTGVVEYATDLFDAETISRLVGHFQTLLEGIVARPEAHLSELSLLTESEHRQLVVEWNNTAAPFPEDKCIHELFEAQVAATPQAVAVIYEDSQLSYAELNAQANRLAHHLRELGVRPDTLVAICVERSLNMVVGLLAILKAGGAYVPLDPTYPKERLAFMLEDSAPVALLTQGRLENLFVDMAKDLPVIDLDTDGSRWADQSDANPDRHSEGLTPRHLAYVIYTSGSTGQPKGITMPHSVLVNLITWQMSNTQVAGTSRTLQYSPISFDVSFQELFSTWCGGGVLVLVDESTRRDPWMLLQYLGQNRIERLFLPFIALEQLARSSTVNGHFPGSLREVITAGEQLRITPEISSFFASLSDCRLVNQYGPSETHVVTAFELPAKCENWAVLPPIGRPISNTQIYILDPYGNPEPIGVAGELYIGGVGVARGYLGRPELAAERFLADPFVEKTTARMYKTGDLGRWLADGTIEFLGRNDFQVKIRGFRVELGDIEATLRRHPQLREVVVGVYEPVPGDKRLVAYSVVEDHFIPDVSELREFVKESMPEYMVPSAFVFLNALPMTPNGKLNRKALPEPEQNRQVTDADFIAPRSPVEQLLAEIWGEVLSINRVGIHDNFFELGGHSLLATQVVVRIREQLSVEIQLISLFEMPTIEKFAAHLESHLLTGERVRLSAIRRIEGHGLPPLSFAQLRMWLLERISGGTEAYNIPFFLQLKGILEDEGALERAINEIVHRHETLRTYFTEQEGVLFQAIQSSLPITLVKLDLRNDPEELRETKIKQQIQAQATTTFDLAKGPLLRAKLIRLEDEQYILLLTFHHIIFDGWSMDVFSRELSALYGAFIQGQPSPLPELPIQYADYAVWQQECLQGEVMQRLLDYWKPRLADVPTLELPTDRPRPAIQSFRGETQQFSLSPELTEALKALSRRESVTLFMTLLASFQALLHRYSGQDDIVIGTPAAGRSRLELEGLIGFFVNTLVLRTDLSNNPSFRALLAQVREVTLDAYAHQDMPFEKLVEVLNPQRDHSRNPLFQVMFVLQNVPDDKLQLNEITAEFFQVNTGTTKFDLTFELSETPHGLTGVVEYATDLFDAETISRLVGHFQTLLEGIVARPEAHLSELSLLTESEHRQLVVEWNNTAAPFPEDKCIHELFEAQVAATPQAVAVIYEDSQLSYAELNAQANRLAHHLRELGVRPDTLVAICVERSLNMVVGLLAILKAGGAYVPLDPTYPKERLAFMLEDSAPVALLTQGRLENLFVDMAKDLPVIDLDTDGSRWADQSDANPDRHSEGLTPRHLAYVIYTSGSTGQPKGVMIEHKSLCNLITDVKSRYKITPEDRILQFAAIAFDMSIQDIFGALMLGATLVVRSDEWIVGARKFWALCEKNGVSVITLPTLFWQQLAQDDQTVIPSTVRRITIGGEAVSNKVLAAWFERRRYRPKLLNGYGPTEATIYSTSHEPSADSLRWQSIGCPIINTCIYILDAYHQPVPIGWAGELYIGGAGIARGYLNRPELTAERFVADPFRAETDARMYKTGDLARRLADGNIEFLGRNDFQVKIRGFRIELGDIEAKLAEHPAVHDVAVIAHEDGDGSNRLVAYLLVEENFTSHVSELRSFLKKKIPEFMVPSAFVVLDALPITPNGKLDRKALPIPLEGSVSETYSAPRNEIEHKLTNIWKKVLGLKNINIEDNFFNLGGHSLLAVKAIAEINELFNTDLPIGAIYQSPTVEELGIIISSGNRQPSWYSLVPIQTQGLRPPLFAIHTITLQDLPQYLGKDQPLYFLRYGMAAVGNRSVRLPHLEDLASHYINEMQQLQPEGPYYLIGFSFGGLIAYEMANQLLANGHKVNLVGLLDTYLTEEKRMLPLHRIIHNFFRQGPSLFLKRVKSKITDLTIPYQYGTDFWPHIYTEAPDVACRNGYQPKTYNGRITLFQGWGDESIIFRHVTPEQGWKKLLGDRIEVQQISGGHFEIFDESHVKTLAVKIIACMDKTINN